MPIQKDCILCYTVPMGQLLKQIKIPAIAVILAFILATVITSCHFLEHPMNMAAETGVSAVHVVTSNVQPCCQGQNDAYQVFRSSLAVVGQTSPLEQPNFALLASWILAAAIGVLVINKLKTRLYDKAGRLLGLFNYLLEAFSQGILHPKIYSI